MATAKITKQCLNCGFDFETWPSTTKKRKAFYCSPDCYRLHQRKCAPDVVRECLYCHSKFTLRPAQLRFDPGKYCSKECYNAYRRSPEAVTAAFWSNVDKRPGQGPDGNCWLWTGGIVKARGGYGKLGTRLAHRYSYQLHYGPLSKEQPFVCHHCDNPPCVRPDHLFAGNQTKNMRDCSQKGRIARGERVAGCRLNAEIVLKVRQMAAAGTAITHIAAFAGVTQRHARGIISRRSWKHL